MKRFYYCMLLCVAMFSCNVKKSETIVSQSPAGSRLKLHGTKIPLDAWRTTVILENNSMQDSVMVEIYADELDDKTVKIEWINDNEAVISAVESDGNIRSFKVVIQEAGLSVENVN